MSYEISILNATFPASADMDGNQFKVVKLDSNAKAALASAATDKVIGVLQNEPDKNNGAAVCVSGITKVIAGGAVTAGTQVQPNTSGQAVTHTSTNTVLGIALDSATASGEIIPVLLK